jgi:hypothetical protein
MNNITDKVTLVLVIAFSILWAIWLQPHTLALRHMMLSLGSLLGMYVIAKNYFHFFCKAAFPAYLIGLLFLWITFHLFYLSTNFALQLNEYETIWKRIIWGAPFALGLGYALGKKNQTDLINKKCNEEYPVIWWIFYVGIFAPTLIYLIRTGLMFLASKFGWTLPFFAMHMPQESTWHIPKMGFIYFCLPALAVACSQIVVLSDRRPRFPLLTLVMYTLTILAVLFVFKQENAKNGFAYGTFLCLLMLINVWFKKRKNLNLRYWIITLFLVCTIIFLLFQHVQRNDSWKTLFADTKLALQIKEIDSWKDYGARGYPTNELGKTVGITNYLRAAWAQVIVEFIIERPLGYGLLYQSFGHYAKEKWPNSIMDTSHSAWLDIAFGIGLPGVFLLLLSGILALKNIRRNAPSFFNYAIFWALLSIFILMLTTEVARRIYFESLIFMILMTTGIGIGGSSERSR